MASSNSLFESLTSSEVRIFQNNSVSPARGVKLLKRSEFTPDNVTEISKTVKLMIKAAVSSNTLAFKNQIEIFGQKLSKSFSTKRIHLKVAPDFLMLHQHITDYLPLPAARVPSPLPPLKDYSSDDDSDSETSPTMTAFDMALDAVSKPKASSVRSASPVPAPRARSSSPVPRASFSRDRTRSRSPLPSKERSRSPKDTKRGEKSKKTKRSRSGSSSVSEKDAEPRSYSSERSSKKRCVWHDLNFSQAKKIKGKIVASNFILVVYLYHNFRFSC